MTHPASLANLRLGKPKQQANSDALRNEIRKLLDAHAGERPPRAKEVCAHLAMELVEGRLRWPSVRTIQWHIREIKRERQQHA